MCTLCIKGYYFNINTQRCMVLPENCLSADDRGRCTLCNTEYALITTYECVKISTINNCKIID